MKRGAATIVVLAFVLTLLSAVSMKSNSIGQSLGPYEEGDRYRLEVTAFARTLYDEGKQLWQEISREEADGTLQTLRTYRDGKTTRQRIHDGVLIEERRDDTNTTYTVNESGRLILSSIQEGANEPTLIYYSYEQGRANLTLVARLSDEGFLLTRFAKEPDRFTVTVSSEEGGDRYRYTQGLTISESWSGDTLLGEEKVRPSSDGSLLVTDGEIERSYARSGLLIHEVGSDYTKGFTYDEKNHLKEIETKFNDGRRVREFYEEGALLRTVEYQEQRIIKETHYFGDATFMETLYDSHNQPYVDVTWAADGQRITSLNYY